VDRRVELLVAILRALGWTPERNGAWPPPEQTPTGRKGLAAIDEWLAASWKRLPGLPGDMPPARRLVLVAVETPYGPGVDWAYHDGRGRWYGKRGLRLLSEPYAWTEAPEPPPLPPSS